MMFIFALLLGFTMKSHAQEISVVDVRRNITLAENDTVYKDFYLNAGPSSGLKKNLVVTAVRKINIRDASGANAVGEIMVPVGQLKVIAVYDKVAVAREFNLLSRDELPMLEQTGIMTGDRIDVKSGFIDTSKPKKQRVTEAAPAPTTVASLIAAATTVNPASIPATPITPKPEAKVENPVETANAAAEKILAPASPSEGATSAETLEKTADSGNNSLHE
jgi:hypothetical protein